jgi:hypothetical protein
MRGSFVPHVMPRSCGAIASSNVHRGTPAPSLPTHDHGPQQRHLLHRLQLFFNFPPSLYQHISHSNLIATKRISTCAIMDDLREHVDLLESSANLSTSIKDIQKAIDQLTAARAKIAAGEYPPFRP